jgi:predicted nucleic acid-binding protein
MRFWDSSAIVPLVVRQSTSGDAERWLAEDGDVVTWTLTVVEVVSALRRLLRNGELPERAAREAEGLAGELARRTHVVTDSERVKALACRLLRVHPLRAADALQLGAALAWADGHPAGLVLHTYDRRLALAAEREGFHVTPDV